MKRRKIMDHFTKAQWNKADRIFERVNPQLDPQFHGQIIAIDPDSGDYYLGSNESDAYRSAVQKHPGKIFIFKRIGYKYAHFIGTL